MRPIVLVHGLGAGRWSWEPVIASLERSGYSVFAPNLAGQEDGSTTLSDHVAEVEALFLEHDLRDVLLVGHSYGGMVITALAERVPQRIAQLVFLDAVYPRDGEASFDCLPELAAALLPLAKEGLIPAPPPEAVGVETDEQAELVRRHQLSLPLGCVQEPITRRNEMAAALPRSYVYATRSSMGSMAERARADGAVYHEIDAPHMVPLTHPEEVAALLIATAERGGPGA